MRVHIDKGIVQHDKPHKGGALWAVSVQIGDTVDWWDDRFYKKPNGAALKQLAKARVTDRNVYVFFWDGKVWSSFDVATFIEECKNAKR